MNNYELAQRVKRLTDMKKSRIPVLMDELTCTEYEARKLSKYIAETNPLEVDFEAELNRIREEAGTEHIPQEEREEIVKAQKLMGVGYAQEDETEAVPNQDKMDLSETIGDEFQWKQRLDVKENYVYNKDTDQYIVFLKAHGKNIVVPGETHRSMLKAYSSWDGNYCTINQICRTHEFPRHYWTEYKKIFGWTHDLEPVTKEELQIKDEDGIVQDLLQQKRFNISQKFQKEDWKETQKEAILWRAFNNCQLDPFEKALEKYAPAPIPPMSAPPLQDRGDKKTVKNALVVGLSDLHFGGKAIAEELQKGKDFNIKVIEDAVDSYAAKLLKDVEERSYKFEQCVICGVGDILHSLTGRTEKGTFLEFDVIREEQFERALNCLNRFINRMLEIFGKVEVHSIKGNHSGPSEWILFKTLESWYRTDSRIKFHNYKTRSAVFRVKNTAVMMDHGDSDYIKAKVPVNGSKRESFIQTRFLEESGKLGDVKSRIFVQGDMHHFEYKEYKAFEFFMFGSAVCGDKYADHLGLHSRARQNALIIDDEGVKEVLHYYFD